MFYFVLPGKTYSAGRYLAGAVVELLEEQAEGWIGESLSKGYKTEAGAKRAAANADAIDVLVDAVVTAGDEAEQAEKAATKAEEEQVSDGS